MGFLVDLDKGRGVVINSDYMKIVVASYYRYIRSYPYVCTELERMDVCACDGEQLTEIECKITKADLKHELTSPTKKKKHAVYSEYTGVGRQKRIIPNRYFVAMTEDMYKDKECIDLVKRINPNYGIIVIYGFRAVDFEIKKTAKKLHSKKISEVIKKDIVKRCSSENIILRRKLYEINYLDK